MNYRKKFENFYRMKIPEGYVIHHIDMDRSNNRIGNLVMLPSKLHSQFHWYYSACVDQETRQINYPTTMGDMSHWYLRDNLEKFLDILHECDKWCNEFFNKRQLLCAAGMYDFDEE